MGDLEIRQRMKDINIKLVDEGADYNKCMTELEDTYYRLLKDRDEGRS